MHWGQFSRTKRHEIDRYPNFLRWLAIKKKLTDEGNIQMFDNPFAHRHLNYQISIALRPVTDGVLDRYVSAIDGGGRELLADKERRGTWETFKLIHLGDKRVALRSHNGGYIMAENGGGGRLIADRPHIRGWERFRMNVIGPQAMLPGSPYRMTLRASNGQYVRVLPDNSSELRADLNSQNEATVFYVEQFPYPRSEISLPDLPVDPVVGPGAPIPVVGPITRDP